MEMIWVWLAVVAVSLIVEFLSWDLTSIWFAIAGLVSLILSAIDGIAWEVQLAVFIVISALLLIFVRKICRRVLLKNANTKTNVDAYIGKRSKLLKAIGADENFGEVKFNGVIWQATSEAHDEIEAGAEVEVVRVEGNKMIVKLIKHASVAVEQNAECANAENENAVPKTEVASANKPESDESAKEQTKENKTTKKTKKENK